jgi:hypothetical protein
MNCNSCLSNSFSVMNNGMQQPMPQVRTVPSENFQAPGNDTINISKNAVEQAVIDAVSKNNNLPEKTSKLGKIKKELTKDIELGENIFVRAITAALTIMVALGWNEAIKYYISRYIKFNQGNQYSLLIYALVVSVVLFIFVRVFYNQLEKKDMAFIKFQP